MFNFISFFYNQKTQKDLNQLPIDYKKLEDISQLYYAAVKNNLDLNKSAHKGFKNFIKTYSSRSDKSSFDTSKINLKALSNSFGFEKTLSTDIGLISRKKNRVSKAKLK